jgi:hypothetical protein
MEPGAFAVMLSQGIAIAFAHLHDDVCTMNHVSEPLSGGQEIDLSHKPAAWALLDGGVFHLNDRRVETWR